MSKFALALLLAAATPTGTWTPADELKDAVRHHLELCHPDGSLTFTSSTGTAVYGSSGGVLFSNLITASEAESVKLRRQADKLEKCEQTEDRLRKLIAK